MNEEENNKNDYDKVNYWIEIADYDLETARVMLNNGRFLYVGFMCHQAVEKILKAYHVKNTKEMPPYIHGLKKIAEKSNIYSEFSEEQIMVLATLEPLNVEGRYPMFKEQISKTLNESICKKLIKDTEELMKWIKNKLEE